MRVKEKKTFSIFGTFNEKNIFLVQYHLAEEKLFTLQKMLLTVFDDECRSFCYNAESGAKIVY